MDDQQVGAAIRTIRQRKHWRMKDLAAKVGVSRSTPGRIERGLISNVPLGTIRKVAMALDARIDTHVRWQGGDLSRLINARHAVMHEVVAWIFAELDGWIADVGSGVAGAASAWPRPKADPRQPVVRRRSSSATISRWIWFVPS